MIQIITDTPQLFQGKDFILPEDQLSAIDHIANAITGKNPKAIALLKKYRISISQAPTREELLSGLIVGFKQYPAMVNDFAKLSAKPYSNVTDPEEEDSETTETTQPAQQTNTGGGGGGWLGAISGIVNGVGGIISLFGRPDSASIAAQTNAQILALAAQKEKARRRNNIIAIVTVSILTIVAGFIIYKTVKKNKK